MLYEVLRTAKMGAGKAPDLYTAIMAQKMPFAKGSGAEHEYTGAVPVTFTANGQPLLDYLISGNTVQSGAPTPDNPIMPQGTGERTGNLFDGTVSETNKRIAISTGGSYNSNGYSISEYIPIDGNTNYIINTTYSSYFAIYDSNKNYIYGEEIKTTKPIPATYANARFVRFDFKTVDKDSIMFNKGSQSLPYEPPGVKIPISSAGQTTPVYLGEVQTTRKIKKLVLTGEESTWRITGTGRMALPLVVSDTPNRGQICYCTHYKGTSIQSYGQLSDGECTTSTMGTIDNELGIYDSNYTTVSDFKAYLQQQYAAGTPVTVWYVLATPTTGIVNEPLRKIGEYADTVSMEQAGVEIPTVRGENTFDVLTDVKPSEVYIKYKGG